MGGWEESLFLTVGEKAKCGVKEGDRVAMCPENWNPEHSCAVSATRATAASHIRANLQDVCLRCCHVLYRAPTPRPAILFATHATTRCTELTSRARTCRWRSARQGLACHIPRIQEPRQSYRWLISLYELNLAIYLYTSFLSIYSN